jgi:hypothetical protein
MGRKVSSKIRTKRISSVVEGLLDSEDLYPLIQKLVPEAPEDATIDIYVDVPGGGDWSNTKLDLDLVNQVKFTVSWEEKEVT